MGFFIMFQFNAFVFGNSNGGSVDPFTPVNRSKVIRECQVAITDASKLITTVCGEGTTTVCGEGTVECQPARIDCNGNDHVLTTDVLPMLCKNNVNVWFRKGRDSYQVKYSNADDLVSQFKQNKPDTIGFYVYYVGGAIQLDAMHTLDEQHGGIFVFHESDLIDIVTRLREHLNKEKPTT